MKKLLGLVVASAVVAGAWHWHGSSDGADVDAARKDKLIYDRIWIDHLPRTETDTFQIFLTVREESFGVFQATSVWAGQYEGFRFEAKGGEMRVVYPQTKERETISLTADDCHEVDNMDYCLDIKGSSRGVKHYYSAEGWEIGADSTVDAALAKVQTLIKR